MLSEGVRGSERVGRVLKGGEYHKQFIRSRRKGGIYWGFVGVLCGCGCLSSWLIPFLPPSPKMRPHPSIFEGDLISRELTEMLDCGRSSEKRGE